MSVFDSIEQIEQNKQSQEELLTEIKELSTRLDAVMTKIDNDREDKSVLNDNLKSLAKVCEGLQKQLNEAEVKVMHQLMEKGYDNAAMLRVEVGKARDAVKQYTKMLNDMQGVAKDIDKQMREVNHRGIRVAIDRTEGTVQSWLMDNVARLMICGTFMLLVGCLILGLSAYREGSLELARNKLQKDSIVHAENADFIRWYLGVWQTRNPKDVKAAVNRYNKDKANQKNTNQQSK